MTIEAPAGPPDRVSIYLKQGDSYFFLARAWTETVKHKGVEHPAVLFDWITSRLLPKGVRGAHITYPDTGEMHATYEFVDKKRLHVSAERMTLSWSRGIEDFEFPDAKFIESIDFTIQRKQPPGFDAIEESTVIVPTNSAILVPIEIPEIFVPKSARREHWKIVDLEGKSGTLNLRPFLAGSVNPVLDAGPWVPSYSADFILRSSTPYFAGRGPLVTNINPYFGWSIRLFPDDAPQLALEAERRVLEPSSTA